MSVNVLYAGHPSQWSAYQPALSQALAARGIAAQVSDDLPADQVDYIVYAPTGPVQDFTPFIRAKAVLNLWAGVERVAPNPTLTQPLCRMVDTGLTEGMRDWVVGHVMRYHLGMDAHIVNPDRNWHPVSAPLARDRRAGILGLGELGATCATALAGLGFNVAGYSRSPKQIDGVLCLSGEDGLRQLLERSEIVVLLLPNTPETVNILNARSLSWMPEGAMIINPGRGPLIDDDALLAALDSGQISHATLDVFRIEPLPQDHPYWAHPRVTVTPHIAAETRPATACSVIAENIVRSEAGQPLLYLVDRDAGY